MTIPLLIGVTGHRDIFEEDVSNLRARVTIFFEMLRRRCPTTPITVFTGLASGADQLVASVASDLGIPVVFVLPMPYDIYVQDFIGDSSGRNFVQEAKLNWQSIELPLLSANAREAIEQDRKRTGTAATAQYASLGNFLAVRCQILLALWDGNDSEQQGGTAFTIHSKLQGRLFDDAALTDPIERGWVYRIATRRKTSERASGKDGFLGEAPTSALFNALAEIEALNASVDHKVGRPGDTPSTSLHETADRLALGLQKQLRRFRLSVVGCLVSLILAYTAYSEYGHSIWSLTAYLTVLLIGAALWTALRRKRIEQRFFDYRAFAEAIRVQDVWDSCGLHLSVADYYLRKHRLDTGWIRFALRGIASNDAVCALLARRRKRKEATDCAIVPHPAIRWMETQRDYFTRALDNRERSLHRLQQLSTFLYAGGIVIAALVLALKIASAVLGDARVITALLGIFPALAGVAGSWGKQLALPEESARYRTMKSLFDAALVQWRESKSVDLLTVIAEDLGKEAIQENADWLSLRRGRPVEVPLGPG